MILAERFRPFPVVTIASSAGGLKALLELFAEIPPDFSAAIAVVQHLDPKHQSQIVEILQRKSRLEMKLAEDGDRIRPGLAIFAPPDHHLILFHGNRVGLSQSEPVHFVRPAADVLFESAAAHYGARVMAVVLTGTGKDGGKGVRAVHAAGGVIIVQDPKSSEFYGMPGTAIDTGCVDYIVPLDQIVQQLTNLMGGIS